MADDLRTSGDAALVVAVGRWRQAALAELYRRHAGAVHGLACRVTGRRELADDVVQEVFTRLWREPERFDPDRGSLRSFLLVQTHRRSVDLVRSETARRRREDADAVTLTVVGDVDLEVGGLILSEQVRAAVAQLPVNERQPIELAYFGGHTYREVASLLSQPEGTVKSRIRTGLTRLRENMVAAGVEVA